MNKRAQINYGDTAAQLNGKTINDLFDAVERDPRLSITDRLLMLQEVRQLTQNAPSGTPLAFLVLGGLGGTLGLLISKYFGMGTIGSALSGLAGYGLGRSAARAVQSPDAQMPGYNIN